MAARTARRKIVGKPWFDAQLAPLTLAVGPETLLAERAAARIVALARTADPETEVTTIDGDTYEASTLVSIASPSLFAEPRAIIVTNGEAAGAALEADLAAVLAQAPDDVWIVVQHAGGARGRGVLEVAGDAQRIACEAITSPGDRLDFATGEFIRGGRRAEGPAVRALVDAIGTDLRELAAACAQLMADTAGVITSRDVDKYYGGRVEVTAFKVADAVAQGNLTDAVGLLRHALDTGTDPVPILAAIAAKLRLLVKVGIARARRLNAATEFGLPPWQVDRAAKELSNWTPEGLATAISLAANADAHIKGLSRDPQFALERAVIAICGASRRAS